MNVFGAVGPWLLRAGGAARHALRGAAGGVRRADDGADGDAADDGAARPLPARQEVGRGHTADGQAATRPRSVTLPLATGTHSAPPSHSTWHFSCSSCCTWWPSAWSSTASFLAIILGSLQLPKLLVERSGFGIRLGQMLLLLATVFDVQRSNAGL